jgi:hypothetical protein
VSCASKVLLSTASAFLDHLSSFLFFLVLACFFLRLSVVDVCVCVVFVQVAAQEGKYLARRFNNFAVPEGLQDGGALISGLRKMYNNFMFPQGVQHFQYRHMGSLAYIGTCHYSSCNEYTQTHGHQCHFTIISYLASPLLLVLMLSLSLSLPSFLLNYILSYFLLTHSLSV